MDDGGMQKNYDGEKMMSVRSFSVRTETNWSKFASVIRGGSKLGMGAAAPIQKSTPCAPPPRMKFSTPTFYQKYMLLQGASLSVISVVSSCAPIYLHGPSIVPQFWHF